MEVRMKARDVMVSPVITVDENETVHDLARLLITKRISAVPVVDSAGKLVGIVTEADLVAGLLSWRPAPATDYVKSHAMKVKDIMTRDVKVADPEAPLADRAVFFDALCACSPA
jgi:CBS domain-containing protein